MCRSRSRKKVHYIEYMASAAWERKRQRKLKDVGFICQDCGAKRRLEVHHLTYARLGKERLKDLRALCHDCHKKRHGHMKDEDDMLDFNTRNPAGRIGHLMDQALVAEHQKQEQERLAERMPRIGASRLGGPCLRQLQYEYFKTPKDAEFAGKTLRIFHRGREGEIWMADWLRKAGFTVFTVDAQGNQKCFSARGGHIIGFMDGVLLDGPGDCGPYPRLWENKVLGQKSWGKIEKEKLRKASPVYYGQMQLYMAYFDLADSPGLFTALNADSMEIYAENIPFDAQTAQELSDRGGNLVDACEAGQLLPRCADREDWFECKMCDYRGRCWQ